MNTHIQSDLNDNIHHEAGRWAEQAREAARQSVQALRERADHVRSQAVDMGDRTVRYVRDEPIKSMLFAAAAGAALTVFFGLFHRTGR